jgi:dTDP-4-amino-4,6-dideoxygalactose transaminase
MSLNGMSVQFNKPISLPEQWTYLKSYLDSSQAGNSHQFSKKCEARLEEIIKNPVRMVTSATHALELMALLLNIQPGDEVILPSFTFVSTANAFALRGANIRFGDNDEFGNLMPSEVERLMTQKTKAVITVDYAGGSADLDVLLDICKQHSVPLLEDAAQAIGARYKGRYLGSIGTLGCLSFHETKNITSGEGGALILGDPQYLERTEILREKGTNRSRFLQGLVDKYTWVDIGSSYVPSEINAAYLYPQLTLIDTILDHRKNLWQKYYQNLKKIFDSMDIQTLEPPSHNEPNYHMFAAIFPTSEMRSHFIDFMKQKSISCPFHYVSLHSSPFGKRFPQGSDEPLKGADRFSQCLARLPLFHNLSEQEQTYVIESIAEWAKQ